MKKRIKRCFASILASCMMFSAAACGQTVGLGSSDSRNSSDFGETENTSVEYSYLAIDINPSIELLMNGETVITVKACNDDAAVLLSGENLENMDVEAATKKIVQLAEELGYLTSENDAVKITVSADEEDIVTRLEAKVKRGAEEGSELAKVNSIPRSADERKVKKLQAEDAEKFEGLNPAKLRLIEAIMQYDETMTYELGASMKVSELADLLEELSEEFSDVIGEEMKDMFQNKYAEAKILAQRRIAEIYGEEYLSAWERYIALEQAVGEIEKNAKNLIINADDVEKLLGMMQSTEETEDESNEPPQQSEGEGTAPKDEQQESPEGEQKEDWKVEDINKYFDKNFHGRFDEDKMKEVKNKLDEILDAYDEDAYVLTAEDLVALEEAWGESVAVETFEELKEFLEAEEEKLEEMRESIPLSEEQEKLIELAEKVLDGLKETVRDLMKNAMSSAREKFKDIKAEKMGR